MICPHCGKAFYRRVSESLRKQILELRKAGNTLRDIEALVGLSFSTVGRVIKDQDRKKT